MKVSLWQQWASNHSSDFTVVGLFRTMEEANKVAEELRYILTAIEQWYVKDIDHDEHVSGQAWDNLYSPKPAITPPERQFAEKYGVQWDRPIDWFHHSQDEIVTVVDQLVFLSNLGYDTYQGPKPFDMIMERLGGQVAVEGYKEDRCALVSYAYLTISCIVPDEITAASLANDYGVLGDYFELKHSTEKRIELSLTQSAIPESIMEKIVELKWRGCLEFRYELVEPLVLVS